MFEWDPRKARSNIAKHRIAFADAVAVFEDPRGITIEDPHPTEDRYVTLGQDFLGRLLVVSWTPRGEDIRIISARRAASRERADYEGND